MTTHSRQPMYLFMSHTFLRKYILSIFKHNVNVIAFIICHTHHSFTHPPSTTHHTLTLYQYYYIPCLACASATHSGGIGEFNERICFLIQFETALHNTTHNDCCCCCSPLKQYNKVSIKQGMCPVPNS